MKDDITEYKKSEDDSKIIENLLISFPEFVESEERSHIFDEDGPYIFFSYFGNFLLEKIDENNDSEFVHRTFAFINSYFDDSVISQAVWDLFNIEIFWRLKLKTKYKNLANKHLKGKALLAFQKEEGRPE
jgi:hypothetical protein